MRLYEVMFVFRPEDARFAEGKTFTKAEIEKAGFVIKNESDLGERELAYQVKKETKGHYYLYEVECPPDKISSLDATFHLKPEILKFLFTRK
jgi:small subunit ribosomal protein S6